MEKKYAYQFIADKLCKDISAGKFPLHKRLPGYRKIGEMYGVCMVTARQAMQTLEKRGIVFVHPTHGTFISPEFFSIGEKSRTFAVVYGTSLIEMLEYSYESWGIMTDLLHGIRQEAVDQNVRIKFIHFEKEETPSALKWQMSQLDPYDGIIFTSNIFTSLSDAMCKKNPKKAILLSSSTKDKTQTNEIALPCASVYERIAMQIKRAGYASVDILIPFGNKEEKKLMPDKLKKLILALQQAGITDIRQLDLHNPRHKELLFQSRQDRLIYAYNTSAVEPVYRQAAALHQVPGVDFEMIAFASGYTFSNFYPSITYFKPEYFELGKKAVRILMSEPFDDQSLFPSFIQGKSSRKIPDCHEMIRH